MESMAKKTVSTRLLEPVAEQADRYAEIHEISRTEALTRFARAGLEALDSEVGERSYTGVIPEIPDEKGYWDGETPGSFSIEEFIEVGLRKLEDSGAETFDDGEEVARSARMPPAIVEQMDERAESQDSTRAVVAAEAIERGLKEDPLPAVSERQRNGASYTVELDAETAELFRRYRLEYRMVPGEVFEKGLNWASAPPDRSVLVNW
jgi:predicted DNA-binding protein